MVACTLCTDKQSSMKPPAGGRYHAFVKQGGHKARLQLVLSGRVPQLAEFASYGLTGCRYRSYNTHNHIPPRT
jgi:hypothetical protein